MKFRFVNFWPVYLISFCIGAISCKPKNKQTDWDKANMTEINPDDPKIKIAVKNAQDNISLLINSFRLNDSDSLYDFYIKSPYKENEIVEHMWGYIIKFENNTFQVIVSNQPEKLEEISSGDTVDVFFKEVEDFMVYKNDSLVLGDYFNKEFDFIRK